MYDLVKRITASLIPKKFLFKNELLFRSLHGLFFIGKKHQCNICKNRLGSFIKLNNEDLLCPFCGSLSRNRRLWQILEENNSIKGCVLHFSPSRSLYRVLKKNNAINYYSSDFESEFLADYKFDITDIDQKSNKFDAIICYHILEHVVDDLKAMEELHRVLKPSGTAYIQTPFKEGNIYEDYSIISPIERSKHFGQKDHVRIYSVQGLKERLMNSGFTVNVKTFHQDKNDFYFGFKSPETVLILNI